MAAEQPHPYPLLPTGTTANRAIRRLICKLQLPLSQAIYVMDRENDIDGPRQPYLSGPDQTTPHPISELSLFEPPASSAIVEESSLDVYRENWEMEHQPELEAGVSCDRCGQKQMPPAPRMTLRASEGKFITIGDYIDKVIPWLVSFRTRLLFSSVDDPDRVCGQSLPSTTALFVQVLQPLSPTVQHEDSFVTLQREFAVSRGLSYTK